MNRQVKRLEYGHQPIRSLAALSAALQIPLPELERIAACANNRYRKARKIPKPDGSFRQPWDALADLKRVQRRIKTNILEQVDYPDYLTGSLRGKDAVANASLHAGAATVICEDIQRFFPNVTAEVVLRMWEGFFRFTPEVSGMLTLLTTKDGSVPEGAPTSSHIANLAFWDREQTLHERFASRDISYSRYVDDISVSSKNKLSNEEISECIASIYGMIISKGLKAKRSKQEIGRGDKPMRVTKLVVNARASIAMRDRKAVRAAVHQLKSVVALHGKTLETERMLRSATGRVARLSQLHPREASRLRADLTAIREKLRGLE